MIRFEPEQPRRLRLRRRQVLSLEQLDQLLDVRVSAFERTVARLVKEFRSKEISVVVPAGAERIPLQPQGSRVTWVGLYEAQVHRLPKMERTEEFLMARRYDFLKARAVAALREVGFPEDETGSLLKGGHSQLPEPAGRPRRGLLDNLERAMVELEALRNAYVEGALYMVLGCVQRYRNLGVDLIDLIQEGNASLFQAVEGFDWRRDVRFKTYAQYWIHQAILKVALQLVAHRAACPIWVQKTLSQDQASIREQGRGKPTARCRPRTKRSARRLGLSAERVRRRSAEDASRYAVSLDAEVSWPRRRVVRRSCCPMIGPNPVARRDRRTAIWSQCSGRGHGRPAVARADLILTRRFGLHGERAADPGGDRRRLWGSRQSACASCRTRRWGG